MIDVEKLPKLDPHDVSGKMILRQHAGEGSVGDAKISLSSTGGLGGCAAIIEVDVAGHDRVSIAYNLAANAEAIARAIIAQLEVPS